MAGKRVVLVAGSDAGHAFPAFALAERFAAAGATTTVYSGSNWIALGRTRGIDVRELPALAARIGDDEGDYGAKMHERAARIAVELAPLLRAERPDVVIADVLTPGGGMAAELLGIDWIESLPHPLYHPSRALPPIGSGMAPRRGPRAALRDRILWHFTMKSVAEGLAQRAAARASVGLAPRDPGPAARMVATDPALEVPRPDWPARTVVIGSLAWEPTADELALPPGEGPLIVIAPSTAETGAESMTDTALLALAALRETKPDLRVAISTLRPVALPDSLAAMAAAVTMPTSPTLASEDLDQGPHPTWIVQGLGRQDRLLEHADVVICGGGHGLLAKALRAGVPVVCIPGGGDQVELASRVARYGAGQMVRPLTVEGVRDGVAAALDGPALRLAAARAALTARDVTDPVTVVAAVLAGRPLAGGNVR